MPTPLAFGAADFQQALLALMPRGRIWRRDSASIQAQLLGALSPSYERSTRAAAQLLVDAMPTTTLNLLPEWESSLGLPDDCAPAGQLTSQRQAAVAARWAARGGQSASYLINLAARLGYTITITQYAPARFGLAKFGDPMRGSAWAYAFSVNAPLESIAYAQFGSSKFGEPFAAWGNQVLECAIKRAAPAHTLPLFAYFTTAQTAVLGNFALDSNILA